jgi:hypothetical protein
MKKITNGIKAKIFSQYYNQMYESDGHEYCLTGERLDNILCGERGRLLLKSISFISDGDAIEVAKMFGYKETDTLPLFVLKQKGRSISERFIDKQYASINGFTYIIQIYQYLQSKGYALPYLDYSVEDLVELGVYKLDS